MYANKRNGFYIGVVIFLIIGLTAGMVYFGLSHSNDLKRLESLSSQIRDLQSKAEEQQKQVEEKDQKIKDYESKIAELETQLAAKKKENAKGKVAYLTFDDGPSANTIQILDILKQYNVKATFFVVGTNTKYNPYMKNIVDDGHCIGLHCYEHVYSKIYKSEEAYFADLERIRKLVLEQTGVDSHIIRFPGGGSNTASRSHCPGIMTRLTKEVQEKGYYYFDWNVDSGDADGNNIAPETLLANIKKNCKGKEKVVILMHDAPAKKTTVQALPSIIEYLKSEGYSFAPLSSASPTVHHHVNN